MQKAFLFIVLLLSSLVSNAERHSYLMEIQLGAQYWPGGTLSYKAAYEIFIKNYTVKVYKADGEFNGDEIKSVRLRPKEIWYPKYNGETVKVEIVVDVDEGFFPINVKTKKKEDINVFIELWNSNSTQIVAQLTEKVDLTWSQPSSSYSYVNPSTFKLTKPIIITSPAKVGLKLSLDFLKIALDSTSTDIPQFQYTVKELDLLIPKPQDSIEVSYFQFTNFSKLLIFLEPYVSEGSFINQEARELYQNIQELKDSLNRLRKLEKSNTIIIDSISKEINSGSEVFSDYEKAITRIRNYYNILQIILYRKQFNKLQRVFDTPISTTNNYEKFHFGIGSSLLLDLRPLYNVSLSRGDTVQFESVSRINTLLSGGLFWSPQLFWKQNKKEASDSDSIRPQSFFSLGLLLNYNVTPNNSQLPGSNPFGLGLAAGYKTQNLGVYLTGNLRLVRQPRQYFINQFKDTTLTFNSLDINDNRIFINKTRLALGLSVMYFFNRTK
jgi:hypothetical protein